MIDKNTNYLGLALKNPLVVSSCGLTSNVESIKKLEDAGVGAVVLKSLFEEQIIGEAVNTASNNEVPEMESYINAYVKDNNINNYLTLIKESKQQCSIPIIASICCMLHGEWVEFAKEIEKSGADALELNIYYMPTDAITSSSEIENMYIETAHKVVKNVSIPVVVKIPNHFTNPLYVINELYKRGVKGVVMFNRFYDPEIEVSDMKITSTNVYTSPCQLNNIIRWMALASSKINTISYGSSSGVYTPQDVIKMLLSGASAVHICSTLYKNNFDLIGEMLAYIDKWAEDHTFAKVSDFVGLLNSSNTKYNEIFERAQFMKYYSSHGK